MIPGGRLMGQIDDSWWKRIVVIDTRRPIIVGEEILMDYKIEGVNKALRLKGNVVHA